MRNKEDDILFQAKQMYKLKARIVEGKEWIELEEATDAKIRIEEKKREKERRGNAKLMSFFLRVDFAITSISSAS